MFRGYCRFLSVAVAGPTLRSERRLSLEASTSLALQSIGEMAPIIALSLLCILLAAAIHYFLNRKVQAGVPPGRFGLPLLGETLEYLKAHRLNKGWAFYDERFQKYGPVFKTSLIGSPTVVVPAPLGNTFLFSNENKLVVNSWPSSVARLLGPDSLTLKTGDEHRRSRAILMAFLKPDALQKFVGRTSKMSREHLKRNWDGKDEVLCFRCMKTFTFSLACNLFVSIQTEAEQEELAGPFQDFQNGVSQLPLNFPGTRYHKAFKSRELICRLLDKHISKRRSDLSNRVVSEDQDLLSVMLTTKDETECLLTDSEIKDNILVLLYAGHDTSSSALTMCIKVLTEHPAWKQRLLEEHTQILAEKQVSAASEYTLQWEDLKKMKWTWRVLQETMRLQPPVQGAFRKAITDFEFMGFKIPKGWKLFWNTSCSHRREEFFPDPLKFDPSRFEGDGPAPYTFVPFGGGPRMCPGHEFAKMEMLVFLHHLIVRFDWELADKNEEVTVDPMPYPKKGLVLKIRQR